MNFTLTRQSFNNWGIVSSLVSDDNLTTFVTLEHAYLQDNNTTYLPKIPNGIYNCIIGWHNLPGMGTKQIYELQNVRNHNEILIHVGNYNNDSEGCILIGTSLGNQMILGSKVAFETFMTLQNDLPFNLTVV